MIHSMLISLLTHAPLQIRVQRNPAQKDYKRYDLEAENASQAALIVAEINKGIRTYEFL
jgi:hypothetical protein